MDIIFLQETNAAKTHAVKLAQLQSVTVGAGYPVHVELVPATDTPEQIRQRINAIDPTAQMAGWAFGPLQKPAAGPIVPDGHTDHYVPWTTLWPWITIPHDEKLDGWYWNGSYYARPNIPVGRDRPGFGMCDYSDLGMLNGIASGIDVDAEYDRHLDHIIAHLTGQTKYERAAVAENHLGGIGMDFDTFMQQQIESAFGPGTLQRLDATDHDIADGGDQKYFSEIAGRKLTVLGLFSGGQNNQIIYLANDPGVLASDLDALLVLTMGSYFGDVMGSGNIERVLTMKCLCVLWTNRVYVASQLPNLSAWLNGLETVGEMAIRHGRDNSDFTSNLQGFPLLKVAPVKIELGVDTMASSEATAILLQIKMNADGQAVINANSDLRLTNIEGKINQLLAVQAAQQQSNSGSSASPAMPTFDQVNAAYMSLLGRPASQKEYQDNWAHQPEYAKYIATSPEAAAYRLKHPSGTISVASGTTGTA